MRLIKKIIEIYLKKENNDLIKILSEILNDKKLTFLDIGASGGIPKRWEFVEKFLIKILVEPDEKSSKDLINNGNFIIDKVLFSEPDKIIDFYHTQKQTCSSLLKPNFDYLSKFSEVERFKNRKDLLSGFANLNKTIDRAVNVDTFTEEAFGVLTSSSLVDALDLSKEDPKIREMYGDGKPFKFQYDGAPTVNEHVLMARRLVEAGARSVTLSYGRWDSHGSNFDLVRDHGAKLDQCVSALVRDLDQRGMLDDTLVVVWGEFGRTPKINPKGGRDHWPQVSCALLAGGGFNHGQTIGETNRLGEVPDSRPVHIQEICATMYRGLGIDTMSTTLLDNTGRPQYLLDHREPLKELI